MRTIQGTNTVLPERTFTSKLSWQRIYQYPVAIMMAEDWVENLRKTFNGKKKTICMSLHHACARRIFSACSYQCLSHLVSSIQAGVLFIMYS